MYISHHGVQRTFAFMEGQCSQRLHTLSHGMMPTQKGPSCYLSHCTQSFVKLTADRQRAVLGAVLVVVVYRTAHPFLARVVMVLAAIELAL